MNQRDTICAIIVTWNSEKGVAKGVAAVAPQVDEIVIVDNGSSAEALALLEEIQKRFRKITILRNEENLGIAVALNRGVRYALGRRYNWVLTLDDDSEPESAMVQKMLEAYYSFDEPDREKIAILAPNYTISKGLVYRQTSPTFVTTAITSGQLVKTEIFSNVGPYREDLFIDGVDHEFCLRLLKFGLKTLLVPSAVLQQRMGPKPELKKILGKKFVVANHSPQRYYYIYRNSVLLYKTYWKYATNWIFANMRSNLWSLAKILLFERQKLEKIAMICRGLWDGARNKYGKIT